MGRIIALGTLLALPLAGCASDADRAAGGQLAGGLLAAATGQNVGLGMQLGAAAGQICDEAGACPADTPAPAGPTMAPGG
ncbi:MAG: hypothetical protein ACU0BF_10205 [Paracoccaceae bacterium]